MKIKENEKRDNYLDLARELKTLWGMRMTVIPIVVGALGTTTKGLEKGLEEWEISGRIQTTVLLRSTKILRKVQETGGGGHSLRLQKKKLTKSKMIRNR